MNLEVLEHILRHETSLIENQIRGTGHDPSAALGVAEILVHNGGNVNALSAKQLFYWCTYLEPLIEKVPCEGVLGDPDIDSCNGDGFVDDESLLLSYHEDVFLCQTCRHDREAMEDL